MAKHTIKAFDAEIRNLRGMVGAMGDLSIEQIARAVEATSVLDPALATRIVEREPEADLFEHQIENTVIRMLALRQPVASDLRETLAALRIANELERICDHAENIAERLITLRGSPITTAPSPRAIGDYAVAMLTDVIDAYKVRDVAKAQDVWGRDQELDGMYSAYFRELLTYMIEDPRRLSSCMHLLFIARDLERVGDRATNVAEAIRFLSEGKIVDEPRPKADLTRSIVIDPTSQEKTTG
jgi:phosphate transport system protein